MASIVQRKGAKGTTYRAIVRIAGQPVRTKSFKTRTHAKVWAQREETKIRDGEVQDVALKSRNCTVAELIDEYCATVTATQSIHTRIKEPSILKWWRVRIGHYSLAQITPEIVSRHMAECASQPIRRRPDGNGEIALAVRSKQSLKHYRDILERVFKKAVEWKWMSSNPMAGVSRITKINNQRVRFLSEEECKRLLAACRQSNQPCLYPMVVFALSTGARLGEITGLTLANLDLTTGLATFRRTKNAEPRRVHIRGHLGEVLREQVERVDAFYPADHRGTRWLFPGLDGSAPIDIRAAWEGARDEAGIQDFRFHDLRHTAASYLAMNGATLMEIATVLGHRTLQMVQRYAHISDKHTADIVERMNLKMFGQGSPRPSGRDRRAARRDRATASS